MSKKSENTADFFSIQKTLADKHEYKSAGMDSFASYTIKTQDKAEGIYSNPEKMALLKENNIDWNPVSKNGSLKFKLSCSMVLDHEQAYTSAGEELKKSYFKVGWRIGQQQLKRDFIENLMDLVEKSPRKAEEKAKTIADYNVEIAPKLAKQMNCSIKEALAFLNK
jgi:hypothetical protein